MSELKISLVFFKPLFRNFEVRSRSCSSK